MIQKDIHEVNELRSTAYVVGELMETGMKHDWALSKLTETPLGKAIVIETSNDLSVYRDTYQKMENGWLHTTQEITDYD